MAPPSAAKRRQAPPSAAKRRLSRLAKPADLMLEKKFTRRDARRTE
jgi:hypothetical protein